MKDGKRRRHKSAIRLAQILGTAIIILQSRDFILERESGGGRVNNIYGSLAVEFQ